MKECFSLTRRIWLFSLFLLLANSDPAWAAPSFPRGDGFYFNPYKIVSFLIVYLAWVRTCGWVSRDLGKLERNPTRWNFLFLSVGIVGISAVGAFPVFWLAWIAFLAGCVAMFLWYVSFRNERVEPGQRVLNRAHLQSFVPRSLRSDAPEPRDDPVEEERPVVHFISRARTGRDKDDDSRVRKSKGYRAAQDLILQASQQRAGEIHLQPAPESMAVRFSVDGMPIDREPLDISVGTAMVKMLKVMANLDVTERRNPQTGFLTAEIGQQPIEIRLATAGSGGGDKTVLRLLDANRKMLALGQLGLREKCATNCCRSSSSPAACFLSAVRTERARLRRSTPVLTKSTAISKASLPSKVRSSIGWTTSPRSNSTGEPAKPPPRKFTTPWCKNPTFS